jgi:hypothetical protein
MQMLTRDEQLAVERAENRRLREHVKELLGELYRARRVMDKVILRLSEDIGNSASAERPQQGQSDEEQH